MKKNTGYWLAFAAGIAAAGTAAYLLNSARGKAARAKVKEKGEQVIDDAEEIISDARDRFETLRTDLKRSLGRSNRKHEEVPGEIVM
jgi:gas vesicle protein